ncbi:MAG TPA: Rne/Rng family ribonuclease [Myxococcales bacterium]|nr:Rne/Rng family ribonuclease [Myxococcales bacterium]
MSNILVINASGQETRVALIEQGTISEYYLERKNEKGIVGNIYKGRVVRVLPGMQAAFVDIGLEKAAFLYVADIVSDPSFPGFSEEIEMQAVATEGDPLELDEIAEPSEDAAAPASGPQEAAGPPAAENAPQAAPAEQTVEQTAAEAPPETAALPAPEPEPAPTRHGPSERAEPSAGAPEMQAAAAAAGGEAAQVPASVEQELVVELPAEEALDDEDDEGEDEDEDLDEGDAAHAAAEAAIAAEEAGSQPDGAQAGSGEAPSPAAAEARAQAGETQSQAPAEGKIGAPAEQRPAARERRGRRRGGRGRRRGGPTRPAEDRAAKPEQRQQQGRERQGGEQQGRERQGGERKGGNGHTHGKRAQIQDLLKEGDEVIVQVVKDPIGSKGARITCHISLPGRHLVFMPTVDHVGISRRIENEKERRRLRELVDRFRPPGTGFIVRTVAENEPEEKLAADIKFLLGLWNEVGKKRETHKAPAVMHPDLDLILRSVRDLFSDDVNKLVIDDRAEYERVRAFVEQVAPDLKDQVELYSGDEPIFDEYGIEQELQKAQNRKVWLKSGGYIIIDQTEALVAIDVNSGRYVGKKGAGASLEDTITKINCEAAKEIVYQLRLRNIGGIIIIDFIDMDKGSNREKVFKTLQEALGADRAKTNVLKISDIGLVEMTRKRVRESVTRLTTESCPICDGRGHVRSKTTMAYEIMREVQRAARKQREDQIVVSCHPEVGKLLQGPEREAMRLLMMKLNKSITVRPQPQYHIEQYDLHGKWSRPDLQQAQRGLSSRGGQRGNGNDRNDRRRDERRREGEASPAEPAGQAKPEPQPAAEKVGD